MQKRKILICLLVLGLLIITISYYFLNQKNSQISDNTLDILNGYVNNGWNIINEKNGDLNGDIYSDKVLVFQTERPSVKTTTATGDEVEFNLTGQTKDGVRFLVWLI